jgi:hypothetical protein
MFVTVYADDAVATDSRCVQDMQSTPFPNSHEAPMMQMRITRALVKSQMKESSRTSDRQERTREREEAVGLGPTHTPRSAELSVLRSDHAILLAVDRDRVVERRLDRDVNCVDEMRESAT